MIKKIIRKVLGRKEKPLVSFSGNYTSFAQALKQTTSYDAAAITAKAEITAQNFKKDKASLDKDLGPVLSQYGALFAMLSKITCENYGELNVVDFGGSNGYFYFQAKNFLGPAIKIQWTVVELPGLVDVGNKYYANPELSFTSDYDALAKTNKPHVLLVSGTVQYLEDPALFIQKWINDKYKYIIIDRTPLTTGASHVKIQQVQKPIFEASFPIHIMNYDEFVNRFTNDYDLLFDFPSYDKQVAGVNALGLVFKRKENI